MAYQSIWYQTKLPQEIIDIFLKQHEKDLGLQDASIGLPENYTINRKIRNNKVAWVADDNWFAGMIYSYVIKSNKQNFLYDISGFESETLQYTHYGPSNFYSWHSDTEIASYYMPQNNREQDFISVSTEIVRKLSVSIQLSDEFEYEGGELQIMSDSGKLYTAPKEKGTVIIFDSRARHRVRKIKSGTRKSLIGWVVGPRWK